MKEKASDVAYAAITAFLAVFTVSTIFIIIMIDNYRPKRCTEAYFLNTSARIYRLAMNTDSKDYKGMYRLEMLVNEYNKNAEYVKEWNYKCPKHFSLEYLYNNYEELK